MPNLTLAGPMEPPDEEPKKLSAAARLSEALASTSITIFGDDTELNWAVCQALSKKLGRVHSAAVDSSFQAAA